jgi:hypothetical protein
VLLALVASLSVMVVGSSPAAATASAPAWWNGTVCDTGNYPGSSALAASYNGVQACGPGPMQGGSDHIVRFYTGAWGEYEWECVELVMRYMYLVYGVVPYSAPGGKDVVNNYPGTYLSKVTNNGVSVPSPGDILSMDYGGTSFGHTAVVTAVSVNGSGTGTVTTMQQNVASNNGWGSISVTNKVLAGSVTGWLHAPGTLTPTDGATLGVASHANGEQDVFWKGSNGNLYEAFYSAGWHGPYNLGMGPLGSPPTVAVVPSTGAQYVFWKGGDGYLYQTYWNGSAWVGPTNLGFGSLGSQPAATAWGSQIDVFWKGGDNNLYEVVKTGSTWAGPFNIGMGPLGSAPSVASHSSGEQDVVWKGADGQLYEAWYSAGAWHGPVNLNMGTLGSAPTIEVEPNDVEEFVFWKGGDGHLYEALWSGSSWTGPALVGSGMGTLGSAPAATSWGSERDVFWRGGDSYLWEAYYTPSTWHGPVNTGMSPIPA